MNYDRWLTDDVAFDRFHELFPELPEVPDYIQEKAMEDFRKKYKIGEYDERRK